jgi:hypothetical protein
LKSWEGAAGEEKGPIDLELRKVTSDMGPACNVLQDGGGGKFFREGHKNECRTGR